MMAQNHRTKAHLFWQDFRHGPQTSLPESNETPQATGDTAGLTEQSK